MPPNTPHCYGPELNRTVANTQSFFFTHRHNSYIQEATGQREPGFYSTVHDLKLLLLRFANERSFSEETGGGGRQSNINLIPYIIHTGLYVINS